MLKYYMMVKTNATSYFLVDQDAKWSLNIILDVKDNVDVVRFADKDLKPSHRFEVDPDKFTKRLFIEGIFTVEITS
jgi:hypothetical protein